MAEAQKPSAHHRILFDWFAPLYDLGMWALGLFLGGEERMRQKVLSALGPIEGSLVLELFCGTGTLAIMAGREGAIPFGLDISRAMLLVAAEKAGREGVNALFIRGDSKELPFSSGSFDRVIVSLGLHEVEPGVVEEALKEIVRILKPGGRLVIFDFHRAGGFAGLVQKLLFLIFEGESVWSWLTTDLQALLKEKGFRDFRRSFIAKGMLQIVTVEKGR